MKRFKERWIARIDGIAIDVIEEKTGFGIVHIGDDKELKDCDYQKERAIANATLIAAAPDLLEMLQDAHRYLRRDGDYKGSGLEKDIKSAIGKALSTTDYN